MLTASELARLAWANWPLVLVFLVVLRLITNRYRHGLHDIPGPFLASLSDLWPFWHVISGGGASEIELHRRYKSNFVRLGPNKVSIASSDAARVIYGYKPVFGKSSFYHSSTQTNAKGEIYENLATTRDEREHAALRRPVAQAYAMSKLVLYEPLIDSTFEVFTRELTDRFVKTGKECPLHDWLQMYAFDVIGELTFSRRLGFLESGKDVGNMMYYTQKMMNYAGIMGHLPGVDYILRVKNPLVIQLVNIPIIRFTVNQIREHQRTPEQRAHPDLVTQFTVAAERYPEIMDEDRIAENARSAIGAGSDTTAVVLRELVYQLLAIPRCYKLFMEEIQTTLRARGSDGNLDAPISWAEGSKMLYFQACMKEALRYHPPLGQILFRDVPKGGFTLAGRYFPEGVEVGSNAWTVHRDREVYGDNADEFYPERWIESPPELITKMENSSLAFGGGPRVCIGKNIALLEITKTIPELFRRFEMELVDPARYTFHSGWLTPQSGLEVRLKLRGPASLV